MKRFLLLLVALLPLSATEASALMPGKASELVTLRARKAPPMISGCDYETGNPSSAACASCPGANPDGTTMGAPTAVQFDTQIMPDGSEVAFTIPDGYVFVVTSYDWGAGVCPQLTCSEPSVTTGTTCPYGYVQQGASIVIDNGATCAQVSRGTSPADGNTWAGGVVDVSPGVVIDKDVKLCLLVNPIGRALPSNYGSARVHGYLAVDE